MTDTPERDPLEELLAPPGPVDTAALRRSLLGETTRRLRPSRWPRRIVLAAALAACYVAGVLTQRWLEAATPVPRTTESGPPEVRPDIPPAPVAVAQDPVKPASDRDRAAQLRHEGDRFLNEENNPEAALHSYAESLNTAAPEDTRFSPDDNWLLMAIKSAREKETRQ
jgi:hypothetical protein